MGTIYFARHGETFWNVEHKICGITDIDLNENGREQARILGQKILDEKIHIDQIFHSPMRRAKDTAQIVSQIINVPVKEEILLKERNCGKYEGTLNTAEEFKKAQQQLVNSYGGGESMIRVSQRIYNFLDTIAIPENKDKTFLIIGHNGIARSVCSYFMDLTNEEFVNFRLQNCELKKYEF